tara:strand:+ start:3042 stop:3644 length:603 start_codon:yes stop_codon:yes gene_type:complete
MATTIIHKKSSVVGRVPLASDLEVGELALNLADKKIYTKQVGGDVIELTSTGLQTSLGSWSLGSADAAGWAINESSDGTMLFISGITTIASLSPAGDFSVAGEVRTNTVVGGATINQLATEWSYNDALNGTLYFQYGGTNLMSLTSTGILTVAGDVNAEDTITLGTATSFYFINGSAARMEITATGVLNLSGDIGANATF